jgi:hypothetical protein
MSGREHLGLLSQHPTDEHDPSVPYSLYSLSLHPGGCHCWHWQRQRLPALPSYSSCPWPCSDLGAHGRGHTCARTCMCPSRTRRKRPLPVELRVRLGCLGHGVCERQGESGRKGRRDLRCRSRHGRIYRGHGRGPLLLGSCQYMALREEARLTF